MTTEQSPQNMPPVHQPASPTPLKKLVRFIVGAAFDIVIIVLAAFLCIGSTLDGGSPEVTGMGVVLWVLLSIIPALGAVFGFMAYSKNTDVAATRFKRYAMVIAIIATAMTVFSIGMSAILWMVGFSAGNFVESALLGFALLGSIIDVPVTILYWASFACAASGLKQLRAHLASGNL